MNPAFAGKLGKGRINPLGALVSIGAGEARPLAERRYELKLSNVGGDSGTAGHASVTVAGTAQEFVVEASSLKPRALYTLLIDGVVLAADVPSSSLGSILFRFTNQGAQTLPAPINPVTKAKHIEFARREF